MPAYTFKDKDTGAVVDFVMKISELDQFKADNPQLERCFTPDSAPSIGDPVRLGLRKPDAGFKEVLQKISERTPGGGGLRDSIR